MTVRFLSVAEQEYIDAFDYYEGIVEGLGDQFQEELLAAIARVQSFPHAWQKLSNSTRHCRLARFPYGLIYQTRPEGILVVAVMHLGRNPRYWVE